MTTLACLCLRALTNTCATHTRATVGATKMKSKAKWANSTHIRSFSIF